MDPAKGLRQPSSVWRETARFDEGAGTVDALGKAPRSASGGTEPFGRAAEGAQYQQLPRSRYANPGFILSNARTWPCPARVAARG
jgi:hypothetical protein